MSSSFGETAAESVTSEAAATSGTLINVKTGSVLTYALLEATTADIATSASASAQPLTGTLLAQAPAMDLWPPPPINAQPQASM